MPHSSDWNKERLETLKKMFPDLFTKEGELNIDELKKVSSELPQFLASVGTVSQSSQSPIDVENTNKNNNEKNNSINEYIDVESVDLENIIPQSEIVRNAKKSGEGFGEWFVTALRYPLGGLNDVFEIAMAIDWKKVREGIIQKTVVS